MNLLAIKAAGLVVLFLGLVLVFLATYDRASGPLALCWLRYTGYLNSMLRPLPLEISGAQLAMGQFAGVFIALVAAVALSPAWWVTACLLAVPILLPIVLLRRAVKNRSHAIDLAMPDFMLALANALRVTPSIGRAMQQVSEVQMGPIADELKIAVQEMRVGTGIEQALYNMGARMNSMYADSAFTGVLIGRQVGGNIPEILESTAETIRELERLHGVLRTKTAEAKGQIYVMACAPPFIGVGYEFLNPGHFDPFFASTLGWMLFLGSGVLWVTGTLIARSMLNVDF